MLAIVPRRFGDDDTRERVAAELRAVVRRQIVDYAIAPGFVIKVVRNDKPVILTEGQEITLNDLVDLCPGYGPNAVMQRLIECWWVLKRGDIVR